MTQDATQTPSLQDWWTNVDENTKQYCSLNDNGELTLNKGNHSIERIIATLTPQSADATIKALVEKFPEVEARVNEVAQEWSTTDDKLKLIGKVARLKDYLTHTNAIGNFDTLHTSVADWQQQLDKQIEENYAAHLALVQHVEDIVTNTTNWKETTQELKDVSDKWKQAGYLDKHRSDELWARLEQAKNKFFEQKRIFHEDQEKEMLQNLDLKLELVQKAEAAAASENWKDSTEIFRELMEQWKTIGRTMHDKNEELWNKFILAKNTFYERKRVHFEQIQAEQETNLAAKLSLIEKAEALKDSNEWNKTSQEYATIMDDWKNIGRVPSEQSDAIWNRLNQAKDHFFNAKRQHFETQRVALEDNYAQKLALAKRAEALKNSNHWREATEELNELMDEWKKIGPVPREHSNTLWEQFITARKYFFQRKDDDRDKRKQHAEKQAQHKAEQANNFYRKLEQELKEEEEKIIDFNEALQNITPGNKAEELRTHLSKLIEQCNARIAQKKEKINQIKTELQERQEKNDAGKDGANQQPTTTAKE